MLEAGERNAPVLGTQPALLRALGDGVGVEELAQHARDPDRLPRLGDHADDPFAEPDLRSDAAFGVSAARDHLEPIGALGGQQDHRVAEAEDLLERLEDRVEQAIERRGLMDPLRELLQRLQRERTPRARRGRASLPADASAAAPTSYVVTGSTESTS